VVPIVTLVCAGTGTEVTRNASVIIFLLSHPPAESFDFLRNARAPSTASRLSLILDPDPGRSIFDPPQSFPPKIYASPIQNPLAIGASFIIIPSRTFAELYILHIYQRNLHLQFLFLSSFYVPVIYYSSGIALLLTTSIADSIPAQPITFMPPPPS